MPERQHGASPFERNRNPDGSVLFIEVHHDGVGPSGMKDMGLKSAMSFEPRQVPERDLNRLAIASEGDGHDESTGHGEDVAQRGVLLYGEDMGPKHPSLSPHRVEERTVIEKMAITPRVGQNRVIVALHRRGRVDAHMEMPLEVGVGIRVDEVRLPGPGHDGFAERQHRAGC